MNGDPTKEFLQYFTGNYRRIYVFIRAQVRCTSDANDAMQETSTVLWERFADFDRSRDFTRWACGIARRVVLAQYRKNGRIQPLFGDAVDELYAERLLVSVQADSDRSDALAECLKLLDMRQRSLLDMRYKEEREVREIADQAGRSESAVYKALTKIHDTLFQCVQHKLAEWGAT